MKDIERDKFELCFVDEDLEFNFVEDCCGVLLDLVFFLLDFVLVFGCMYDGIFVGVVVFWLFLLFEEVVVFLGG